MGKPYHCELLNKGRGADQSDQHNATRDHGHEVHQQAEEFGPADLEELQVFVETGALWSVSTYCHDENRNEIKQWKFTGEGREEKERWTDRADLKEA